MSARSTQNRKASLTVILELHILQNFVPANLNRDDTGSPKDCVFGGARRGRISSQCFKRAIRTQFKSAALVTDGNLSQRTKRLVETLAKRLAADPSLRAQGVTEDSARPVAVALLNALGLKVVKDGKTEYLLFLAESEIQALAELAVQYWSQLRAAAQAQPQAQPQADAQAQTQTQTQATKSAANKDLLPHEVKKAMLDRLDGGHAADLALFGRMIANLPEKNVEAACQVAHAISTNKVEIEFDFYTAVDDLKPDDTAGADMLGTVEFNSSCFYRYASVDTDQLRQNLASDPDITRRTVEAFLRASVDAIPTGKQNSMAAHNPPSLVMIVVRERGQWNLANAFVRPIRPTAEADLVQGSILALDDYWARLSGMYGGGDFSGIWLCTTEPEHLSHLKPYLQPSCAQAISAAVAAVFSPVAAVQLPRA
jgi:CRISPR system Cascade subunit CasC